MSASPLVTVVIPTLGTSNQLRSLLTSLSIQESVSFEAIVVANLACEKTKLLVAEFDSRFAYLESGKLGVNFARNFGLHHARGEIVVYLDDDCVPTNESFLRQHLSLHYEHPAAIGIGGHYLAPANLSTVESVYLQIAEHWLIYGCAPSGRASHLLGGNCSFKRKRLIQHKAFNEEIFFGGSETELCRRLVDQDDPLILSHRIPVEHRMKMGLRELLRKAYLQGFNAEKYQLGQTQTEVRNCPLEFSQRIEMVIHSLYEITFREGGIDATKLASPRRFPSTMQLGCEFGRRVMTRSGIRRLKQISLSIRALYKALHKDTRSSSR